MESQIGWEAEQVELKAELSRLEEELAESRAETEELRSRSNVLSERLSQTLDSSISHHWEREWRKKMKEGTERESRQAMLIQKLQQKAESEHFVLNVDVLEAGKMDKRKDLSKFDKGQIVMARPLDQNISKTAALVGGSRSSVVRIYRKWAKEGTVVNRRQGYRCESIIYKWRKHGRVENLPRSGRLTKITPRAQRQLIHEVTKDPTTTSKELQASLASVKVKEYRSRCEHLQHHFMAEEREMRVRERILQDERNDNLETTLIRLEEEQQRSVTLVEVNALLRSQLSQSAEANQALQEDLKKLTADWSKAVEEAGQKEMDWSKEKEVLSRYLEAERSRLMSLWSRVVDLRRQCHMVKSATDKDLWQLKAEFTRLSSTFLSLSVRPALSAPPPPPPPPPPLPLYTSGPMTLAELDHEVNTEKLKSRIDELTAIIKSQELERQRKEDAMKNSIKKEEKEQELQQEKYKEMERQIEYIKQALIKLYRSLASQRSNGHTNFFPDLAVFSDDLHSILWVIAEIESTFQWEHKELQVCIHFSYMEYLCFQAAEGKSEGLRMETESLQQQIAELKNEKVDLQKQASLVALELKQTQSLLNSEKETALSLKRQLDESERRSEELKKSNVRLIQQRERADEERNELEREQQKRMEAELVENARLCEQQSHTRIELHTLQVVLEQEREGKAIADKELADTRDALAKPCAVLMFLIIIDLLMSLARESLLSLSSTHTMLQRENADTCDTLEKMATLNESLTKDKRELSARSLQVEEEVTEFQLQLQHLKSDVASLQKELNAVSEENTELRALRDADLDSLHLLRVREREMEGELQILREESERESNALSDEKRKNEQLSEQNSSVCVELHDVKVKLDKVMDKEKRAQREREELQREKQRLEEQVHKIGQEKEEIKQDREDLRNLSGNLQQQLCVAKEQISVLEVQHTQLQMQVHTLQQAKDVLHAGPGQFTIIESLMNSILDQKVLEEHMMSRCEEESKERVCTMQRAVAELEVKLMKLQQRNQRLEHRIEKLRLEKMNLRDTLKQVELEREKLRCQLSQSSAEIQDHSSSSGADELKCLRARASELTAQVHQLRLLLASDHQERADFIDQSLRNSNSLQTLRQDLNDSLTLVSKQLAPSVLECETQRLDRSIRGEQLRILLSHS
ncbi:hypothetical protein QTP70_022071 [Hemibagrus guttatus]|uniref:Rootletin-like coiled-coil domain-containing protein n=1 Tax=Hemibagrus guttatus TaxID=175788 RepID=A0AAE0R525_9TELE|nr:hypothetical protein QTP70_022071 [Hemibagrus guttatus]